MALHGDGVKVLALWVDDAVASWEGTTARGAESAFEPTVLEDEYGKVTVSAIKTYGETIHTFVQRSDYKGHSCRDIKHGSPKEKWNHLASFT